MTVRNNFLVIDCLHHWGRINGVDTRAACSKDLERKNSGFEEEAASCKLVFSSLRLMCKCCQVHDCLVFSIYESCKYTSNTFVLVLRLEFCLLCIWLSCFWKQPAMHPSLLWWICALCKHETYFPVHMRTCLNCAFMEVISAGQKLTYMQWKLLIFQLQTASVSVRATSFQPKQGFLKLVLLLELQNFPTINGNTFWLECRRILQLE